MADIDETIGQITRATSWDERIQAIRRIPERHGQQEHQAVYAAVAEALYRSELSPQVAFVAWRAEYEFDVFATAYHRLFELTGGFAGVTPKILSEALFEAPELLALRTIVGYTPNELVECKQTNDGGTARDKAARYGRLRDEATRLGGVALFAILDGFGWQRWNDALGPVVRDCDGRVFTLKTLRQILEVQPVVDLVGTA